MEKLSSLFSSLPSTLPRNDRLKEQVVFWAYRRSVGEKTAERLKPVSFDGEELVLECTDQRWLQVMNKDSEKEKLIRVINDVLYSNAVKEIRIKSDT